MFRTLAVATVVTALACMGNLPLEFVKRAMQQERAEMILIIAKAIGLSWSTARAILCVRAGSRGISGGEISKSLASYERLQAATAQEIVRFHRLRDRSEVRPPT